MINDYNILHIQNLIFYQNKYGMEYLLMRFIINNKCYKTIIIELFYDPK